MWWGRGKEMEQAQAVDERSRAHARSAEEARSESARLAAVAKPVQQELRDQYERNHWAELIFGRLN